MIWCKIIRDFHKQVITKQSIYKSIFASQTGMDYSPGIRFDKSLIYIDEEKSLTKTNQKQKHKGKAVSLCLHQAPLVYLQGLPHWNCFLEGENIGFVYGAISIWGK